MAVEDLRTPVWQLIGMTGSTPGILELSAGRIAFSTETGRVFEAPLREITVVYPWYYFGGGCKITHAGKTYRISFVRPNNAADLSGRLLSPLDDAGLAAGLSLLTAGRKLSDIGQGRKAGKAWKAALASATG
jgi:hypothetical protein